MLFLDGGGIKGLVQIEALMQLEEATGRKITELFDWIIGTSTGGIVALALVYGMHNKLTLKLTYTCILLKVKIVSSCVPTELYRKYFCNKYIL